MSRLPGAKNEALRGAVSKGGDIQRPDVAQNALALARQTRGFLRASAFRLPADYVLVE
jgi:predicted TIM-barrel enzyme